MSTDTRELERLLDSFKRCSQLAGIAQQKAVTDTGSQDDTAAWLDKAEEKRAQILAWVQKSVPPVTLAIPTVTTTHPVVRDYSTSEGRETLEAVAIAAAKAPAWLRAEFEDLKEKCLRYGSSR